jgi:hypothetical protein
LPKVAPDDACFGRWQCIGTGRVRKQCEHLRTQFGLARVGRRSRERLTKAGCGSHLGGSKGQEAEVWATA